MSEQTKGVKPVCAACGSEKTALRINKKPRWHETTEAEFLCHRCYNRSRMESKAE